MRLCCDLVAPSKRSKVSCSAAKATVDVLWVPTVPGVGVTPEMTLLCRPAVALNLMIFILPHFILGDEGPRV